MPRRRREFSADQRAEIWKRWKAGQSLSDISWALGRMPGTVHGLALLQHQLHRPGFELRAEATPLPPLLLLVLQHRTPFHYIGGPRKRMTLKAPGKGKRNRILRSLVRFSLHNREELDPMGKVERVESGAGVPPKP